MHTFLRRALPATLVASGLALAAAATVVPGGRPALPVALLLVLVGGLTALIRHRAETVAAPPLPPVPPALLLPTQRRPVRTQDVPTRHVDRTATPHRSGPPRAPRRADVRDALPRQRRAPDGS